MFTQSLFLCFLFIGVCWIWEFSEAEPCPELYRRYSQTHTFCLAPNLKCDIKKRLVNADSMKIILKEHNRYRSTIAMGQETVKNLPEAADMLHMEWDDELAAIAQKHADQCKFAHDHNHQRQTKNFDAGQNLYTRYSTGTISRPSWRAAVKAWYDEVSNFDKSIISPFDPNKGQGVIGHFTQLAWSKSWKIGCGYTIYKEGDFTKELYVCNYGPAGNMLGDAMYKVGETCSQCPINSCCGTTCIQADFPGLCKLTDNRGPRYENPAQENALFFCNFESESMCPINTPLSPKKWEVANSYSGSYIGIVLEGGESTVLNVTKSFKSDVASCFSIHYRKGPNVAGQESANTLTEHFLITNSGTDIAMQLNHDDSGFYQFGMNLNWANIEFLVSFTFSVPLGKPAQYVELKDIMFNKGSC